MHKTILGFLSQFHELSRQGEVLCTQGLAFILRDPTAAAVFARALEKWTGISIPDNLRWRAEAYQEEDAARPDLEGVDKDGSPQIKIEAKLGAQLSGSQLLSYVTDLEHRTGGGILLVLVPRRRVGEATHLIERTFSVSDPAPWHPEDHTGITVAVISWHDLVQALTRTESPQARKNLEQLSEMVNALTGGRLMPLASEEEVINWRERKDQFIKLIDRTTKRLKQEYGCWMGPWGHDLKDRNSWFTGRDYYRRYLCIPLGDRKPCFSIGVRHPFEGETTPLWLRFNSTTPLYKLIRRRLEASDLSERLVISGDHVWYPLYVPLDSNAEEMVTELIRQAGEVLNIAYKPVD